MAALMKSSGPVMRMEEVKCKVQKRYKDNEFYCMCCCIGLRNQASVQSHYNSRMHKEKEEASWIISVLEKLPPISAESIHVINDLVECVYREHSAAATGQLKVRKEIVAELQTIVQSVMPGGVSARSLQLRAPSNPSALLYPNLLVSVRFLQLLVLAAFDGNSAITKEGTSRQYCFAFRRDVVVRLFGSSETGFALNTSDVNIFLDFPDISGNRCEVMKKFLSLTQSKSEIYDSVEEDLFAWNKIPHILLRHKASGLLCDVRIMDSQPASIATLLNKYASIDERVVKLVTVFRYWAKSYSQDDWLLTAGQDWLNHIFNLLAYLYLEHHTLCQVDLQENGHYPAHMFAIMVVHYLQQLQPPVLPVLHELIERDRGRRDTEVLQPFDNTYLSDLSDLSAKWTCKNHESLGALWYGLLRYYGLDFKMKQFAVSILQLAPLQKSKREWMSRRLATSSYKLVVEDPCNSRSNLARAASLDKVMQYFVMSIRKTLVYFSGMEYRPTVANGEDNPVCDPVCVNFEEDKHCASVSDDVAKHDDESEDLLEPNQRVSLDELCVLDAPDEQYIDEQGDTFQEQAMNELGEARDMHVYVIDEHFDVVKDKGLDGGQATVAENSSISAADTCSFTALNVIEQDGSSCTTNQDFAIEKETDNEALPMYDRIAEEGAELHQNDSPMDSWPDLSPEAASAVKVSTSLVNGQTPLGCTDNLIPDPDIINTLSAVTLEDTGEAMVPTVATIVDNAKPTSVAMVSESISVSIVSPHPISYEFIKENFAYQHYPVGCLTCRKLDHHIMKDCPDDKLSQCPPNFTVPDKNILHSLKQAFKSYKASCRIDDEDMKRRERVCDCILSDIRPFYPGAQLEMFGSSTNGFGMRSSDLDLCLKEPVCSEASTSKKVLENIATLFRKRPDKYKKIVAITNTRVPIIKFYLCPMKANCDISLENLLAMRNTKLLKTYADLDPRVAVLGYAFKHFAKVCGMADASTGGLSSYAYILMLLHYLQRTDPPVIPVLQELPSTDQCNRKEHILDGWNCYFFEVTDQQGLMHWWPSFGKNHDGIGVLWLGLLRYFCQFDWQRDVVSIRQSGRMTKFDKWWLSKPMCIEDPFELDHNLGQPVSIIMRQYILKRFQDALSYHSLAMSVWRDMDHVMDPVKLGCDSRPPVRKICSTCNQLGHKDVDCPSLGPKKGHEPHQSVMGIDGGPVVSQRSRRRPKPKPEYYRARKGTRHFQDVPTVPEEVGQRRERKQRAAVTQDIGAVDPGLTSSVARTTSVHFKAQ